MCEAQLLPHAHFSTAPAAASQLHKEPQSKASGSRTGLVANFIMSRQACLHLLPTKFLNTEARLCDRGFTRETPGRTSHFAWLNRTILLTCLPHSYQSLEKRRTVLLVRVHPALLSEAPRKACQAMWAILKTMGPFGFSILLWHRLLCRTLILGTTHVVSGKFTGVPCLPSPPTWL